MVESAADALCDREWTVPAMATGNQIFLDMSAARWYSQYPSNVLDVLRAQ